MISFKSKTRVTKDTTDHEGHNVVTFVVLRDLCVPFLRIKSNLYFKKATARKLYLLLSIECIAQSHFHMDKKEIGGPVHVEPVLAVNDVVETVNYWHDTLGFTETWTWGEPPNHGGVVWNGTFIQFTQNAELAAVSKGNSIFIRVRKLQALYTFHQNRNAEILEPLENKPWGMAGYTIRDINGYYIVFAGAPLSGEQESVDLPPSVKIVARAPSVKEYQQLTSSVGWSLYPNDPVVEKILAAPIFAVIAIDSDTTRVVGCALLLGDDASFYYVKDVVVHPQWQHKQVGSSMMKELNNWLDIHAADKALVALISGENLSRFYGQFGFSPAFGMVKYIQRNKS